MFVQWFHGFRPKSNGNGIEGIEVKFQWQRRDDLNFDGIQEIDLNFDGIEGINSITVLGRLELELCERKTLLPGWWLEAGAGAMWEGNTVALEGWRPAERSDYQLL